MIQLFFRFFSPLIINPIEPVLNRIDNDRERVGKKVEIDNRGWNPEHAHVFFHLFCPSLFFGCFFFLFFFYIIILLYLLGYTIRVYSDKTTSVSEHCAEGEGVGEGEGEGEWEFSVYFSNKHLFDKTPSYTYLQLYGTVTLLFTL